MDWEETWWNAAGLSRVADAARETLRAEAGPAWPNHEVAMAVITAKDGSARGMVISRGDAEHVQCGPAAIHAMVRLRPGERVVLAHNHPAAPWPTPQDRASFPEPSCGRMSVIESYWGAMGGGCGYSGDVGMHVGLVRNGACEASMVLSQAHAFALLGDAPWRLRGALLCPNGGPVDACRTCREAMAAATSDRLIVNSGAGWVQSRLPLANLQRMAQERLQVGAAHALDALDALDRAAADAAPAPEAPR